MEERLFHGYECDTVIYVGSEHLLIVTFSEDVKNPWYQVYQSALTCAAEKNLIKKLSLIQEDTRLGTNSVSQFFGSTHLVQHISQPFVLSFIKALNISLNNQIKTKRHFI